MIYLLIGEDNPAKDKKISEIKTKVIRSDEAQKFDFEMLYGHKLNSDILKKAILSLPVMSSKRLVIIRSVHQLSPHNLDILIAFFDSPDERIDLVLESPTDKIKGDFIPRSKEVAQIFRCELPKKLNVFDMTNAMSRRNVKNALKILSELLSNGNVPVMIMGGLVWFWGTCRRQISSAKYHQGLFFLQEADLNIKRTRLKPDYALELLVAKLTSLL